MSSALATKLYTEALQYGLFYWIDDVFVTGKISVLIQNLLQFFKL